MRNLLIILCVAALVARHAFAASDAASGVTTATNAVAAPESNEAIEREFKQLMEADDEAQAEVDKWIRDNDEFAAKGAGTPGGELKQRILDRFQPVRKAYEDFLQQHPAHVEARIAYASFLGDIKDEESAREQLEKALALDTNNPAIYNNLANICGHIGPVMKSFEYYERAIRLNPLEPVYYHNLGTTVYLFRTDAEEFYHIDEAQVFNKAFVLYSNAMRLDPMNFPLASDVAQTYYGLTPLPTERALGAWTNALNIAHDEIEREGVFLHFARVKILAGRFTEARAHLDSITNAMYTALKQRLERNLGERERAARTNAVPEVEKAPAAKS